MNSSGGLRGSPWRALAWRLFLNVLPVSDPPVDDWREIISSKREQYSQFKAELYPDFERVRGGRRTATRKATAAPRCMIKYSCLDHINPSTTPPLCPCASHAPRAPPPR